MIARGHISHYFLWAIKSQISDLIMSSPLPSKYSIDIVFNASKFFTSLWLKVCPQKIYRQVYQLLSDPNSVTNVCSHAFGLIHLFSNPVCPEVLHFCQVRSHHEEEVSLGYVDVSRRLPKYLQLRDVNVESVQWVNHAKTTAADGGLQCWRLEKEEMQGVRLAVRGVPALYPNLM